MTASKKKTVRTRRGVEPAGRPARRVGSDARASEFDVRVFRALRRTDEPQTNIARLNTSW